MKITSITKEQIPSLSYEGYLWKSDVAQPEVFDNRNVGAADLQELPFVIEGLLYAEKENISIRITNIDGKYFIAKMEVADYDASEVQTYVLDKKKFSGKEKIKLYQHFELQPDEINDDWDVLRPTWFAFVGF